MFRFHESFAIIRRVKKNISIFTLRQPWFAKQWTRKTITITKPKANIKQLQQMHEYVCIFCIFFRFLFWVWHKLWINTNIQMFPRVATCGCHSKSIDDGSLCPILSVFYGFGMWWNWQCYKIVQFMADLYCIPFWNCNLYTRQNQIERQGGENGAVVESFLR